MKSFFQFLSESASQQAARMGLVGDGHGGWYDRFSGEFIAKTEKGQLKFYNKRQKVGGKDPKQTETEKNYSDPNFVDPAIQQQAAAELDMLAPKLIVDMFKSIIETGESRIERDFKFKFCRSQT